jgi:hypothetical protein
MHYLAVMGLHRSLHMVQTYLPEESASSEVGCRCSQCCQTVQLLVQGLGQQVQGLGVGPTGTWHMAYCEHMTAYVSM